MFPNDPEMSKPDSYNGLWDVDSKGMLRPVTVRQMLEARRDHSGANLAIDGHEVTHVTVVASVVSVDNSDATRCDFWLEDGTRGRILGRKWCSENQAENVYVNDIVTPYVRIIGTLEKFGKGQNYLDILKIRKVTDYHELCFHLLDAIVTTLIYERGPPSRNIYLSQSSEDGQARYSPTQQPSTSQRQDVFDTSFAMYAMHDSLPAPSEPATTPAFQPSSSSRFIGDAVNSQTQAQQMRADSDTNDEIDGSPDEGVSFQKNKGKDRATPIVNDSCPKSSELLFTPIAKVPQPSSSSRSQSKANLSTQSSPEPTMPITYYDNRVVSAANGTPSTLLSPAKPPFLDTSITFTERKLDPYSDVSVLGRRILLLMFESEQSSPIYRMAEAANTGYQGVDVGTIMTHMHSLDSSLTPTDVDDEITFLLSEGYIYTTVDDCHVRITRQTH